MVHRQTRTTYLVLCFLVLVGFLITICCQRNHLFPSTEKERLCEKDSIFLTNKDGKRDGFAVDKTSPNEDLDLVDEEGVLEELNRLKKKIMPILEAETGLIFKKDIPIDFAQPDDLLRADSSTWSDLKTQNIGLDDETAKQLYKQIQKGNQDSIVNLLACYDPQLGKISFSTADFDKTLKSAVGFLGWSCERDFLISTLTHELVHGLDDQHFGLDRSIFKMQPDSYRASIILVEGRAEYFADKICQKLKIKIPSSDSTWRQLYRALQPKISQKILWKMLRDKKIETIVIYQPERYETFSRPRYYQELKKITRTIRGRLHSKKYFYREGEWGLHALVTLFNNYDGLLSGSALEEIRSKSKGLSENVRYIYSVVFYKSQQIDGSIVVKKALSIYVTEFSTDKSAILYKEMKSRTFKDFEEIQTPLPDTYKVKDQGETNFKHGVRGEKITLELQNKDDKTTTTFETIFIASGNYVLEISFNTSEDIIKKEISNIIDQLFAVLQN